MLSPDDKRKHSFTRIFSTNHWNSKESRSGKGSSLRATEAIRPGLQAVLEDYSIKTMLDIPCGDFNWMKVMDLSDVDYLGADIVPELIEENTRLYKERGIEFAVIDAVADRIPEVDLIFCRDMLQHLPKAETHTVLWKFKESGSKFLLVTSYNNRDRNGKDIEPGGYSPWNLFLEPFYWENPLRVIHEGGHSTNEHDKAMYLFDLRKVRNP